MRRKHLAPDGRLKSGLKLIGSKTGNKTISGRSKIYQLEPPGVTRFVELFLGSGGVLVGKDAHKDEYVIDINNHVINFFKCLQSRPKELWYAIFRLMGDEFKFDRDRFNELRKSPPTDELELAAWYYIINKHARNGIIRYNLKGVCNSTFGGEAGNRGIFNKEWYKLVYRRIKNVRFGSGNYLRLLAYLKRKGKLDKKTWIVADPPYSRVFTMYDKVRFSDKDHVKLKEALEQSGAYWLLTINDNKFIRKLYKGYNIIEHNIHYCCSNTNKGRGPRSELIITNYDCTLG